MALNTKRLGRTKKSTKGNSGGFFRLEEGKNIIRVFTFNHKVTKSDFTKGLYKKNDGIDVGQVFDEVEREVPRHFTEEGVVNCPKGDCEWCVDAKELLDSKQKADKKAGKQLSASKAFYVNLVDIQSEDREMQIGGLPQTVFDVILGYIIDPEFGEDILGEEGRDFIVDRDKSQSPSKVYSVKIRDEKRCEKLEGDYEPEDLFDGVSALEPGWSSNEDLNSFEGSDETDKEKVDRKKSAKNSKDGKKNKSKSKNKDENPFKDGDDNSSKNLPWDKNDSSEAAILETGDTVSFEDEDEGTLKGVVCEINDEVAAVQTGKKSSDIFDIPFSELTLIKKGKKKSGGRRRR